MSKDEAFYQSLAASGAVLIAFIGVCHEFIGATLFPWAPAFFGGLVGFHAIGLAVIALGLALLGGTLRLFRFPVVLFSLLAAIFGAVFVVIPAVLHHQFHMLSLAAVFGGLVTAYCHPKAGG